MYLFGKNSMPDVNNLLTSFYQLDDEAGKEVVETIQFKLQYHKDKERAEQVKRCCKFFCVYGGKILLIRFRYVPYSVELLD